MEAVQEKTTQKNMESRPVDGYHRADSLGEKIIFRLAGNRIFRIDPLPRGKMADVPLQKNKNGLTSADVLNYLREDTSDLRSAGDPSVSLF
ncbi:hypothetical protein FACS189493_3700 [Spirochaetia bacterium]|nr:hypothetical protein FACS189493_3700 [Spirochaetia bacterium]